MKQPSGDIEARSAAYHAAIQAGLLTINECRKLEGLEDIGPAGDGAYVPLPPIGPSPFEQDRKRFRILRVSRELLIDILKLPLGTKIIDLSNHVFFDADQFALKVEHPSFKPVAKDEAIPVVDATYRREETAVFDGWKERPTT